VKGGPLHGYDRDKRRVVGAPTGLGLLFWIKKTETGRW